MAIISSSKEVTDNQEPSQNLNNKTSTPIQVWTEEEGGMALRPEKLSDYIGQQDIKRQLKLILDSAKIRDVVPEHILVYGPPGLGKTTLASLVSTELGFSFKALAAPSLQKIGDLVSLLLNLEPKTVLFIDEIHRLKAPLEEILYSAMEDRKVDLVMGKGAAGSVARLDLPEFTLIGATTQLGKISKPLKDRFPTVFQLQLYADIEIVDLIDRNLKILNLNLTEQAKMYLCSRCRGTPRITNNILKRLLDYQIVHDISAVDLPQVKEFLNDFGIHELGLTNGDISYLKSLLDGSLGLKTLSGMLMEEAETLETVVEPYLIYLGFIDKSSTGRRLTPKGREFLKGKSGLDL